MKDILTSALVEDFEQWLNKLGEYSIRKFHKLKIPTACKRELIEYALNFTQESDIEDRRTAHSRIVYEFFDAQGAFKKANRPEFQKIDEQNIDELKNFVLENLEPQPQYFGEKPELFKLLAVEYNRRNPNCKTPNSEKIVESLRLYYGDEFAAEIQIPKLF